MSSKSKDPNLPSYENLAFYKEHAEIKLFAPDDELNVEEGSREILQTPTAPVLNLTPELKTLTYSLQALNNEEIYDACMNYIKQDCCYGSKFVKQMKLTDIKTGGVFQYTLETFCEQRESANVVIPFVGQPIDGSENGPVPQPWDMIVPPSSLFKNGKTMVKIPHTSDVKRCDNCNGRGRFRCRLCGGNGEEACRNCVTMNYSNGCSKCHGTEITECTTCYGSGKETCSKCKGSGKLEHCSILTVTWTTFRDEFASDSGNLPLEILKKARVIDLFFEECERLLPIANAPDATVNMASAQLIQEHLISFPKQRILMQRQALHVVPVSRIMYKWKDKEGDFYIFGTERNVYFEDYPQKCCCCICC